MKVYHSSHFIRAAKKLPADVRRQIVETETIFLKNYHTQKLKTHRLSGKLKNYWSFSVNYECRIFFKYVEKNAALFIDVGDHSIYQ